jgi:hypothetical protein
MLQNIKEIIMTLDEKKEFTVVVSVVVAVSLIVLINLLRKFDIYDFVYFIICIGSLVKYIIVKTKK